MVYKRRSYRIDEASLQEVPKAPVEPLSDDHPWDDAVQRFLENREILGRSAWTVRYYRERLRALQRLLTRQEVPVDPRGMLKRHIEKNVILFCQKTGYRRKTINGYLIALKAFFGHLRDEGLIKSNPVQGVKQLPKEEQQPRSIEPSLLPKILAACDQERFTGVRDYAMLLVLLDTGIRLKELLMLQLDHVFLGNGIILVAGLTKSRRERRLPFGPNCRDASANGSGSEARSPGWTTSSRP